MVSTGLVGKLFPGAARRALITHRTPTSQLVFEARTRTAEAFDRALEAATRWPVVRDIKPRTDLLDATAGLGSRQPAIEATLPQANILMMENGSASGSGPATGRSSVRALKALTIGSVNGKISAGRTITKALGLVSVLSVIPFMAVSGPVGAASLLLTGPLALLLYRAGRSQGAAPATGTPPSPGTKHKFPFFHVEQKIPAAVRTAIYALYGLELFGMGVSFAANSISSFVKVALPVVGAGTVLVHGLISRRAAKNVLAKEEFDAAERKTREQEDTRRAHEEAILDTRRAATEQGAVDERERVRLEAGEAEARKQPAQKLIEAAQAKNWQVFVSLSQALEKEDPENLPKGEELALLPIALDYARTVLGDKPLAEGSPEAEAQAAIMPLLTKIDPLLPKVD